MIYTSCSHSHEAAKPIAQPTVRGKRPEKTEPASEAVKRQVQSRAEGHFLYETFDNFERNYRPKSLAPGMRAGKDWMEANWTAVGNVVSDTSSAELLASADDKPIWPHQTFCTNDAAQSLR